MTPDDIVDRWAQPQFKWEGAGGQLDWVQGSGVNPVCGDTCTVYLRRSNDVIVDMRHQSDGCTICCASADILCEQMISKSVDTQINLFATLGIPIGINRRQCVVTPITARAEAVKCSA